MRFHGVQLPRFAPANFKQPDPWQISFPGSHLPPPGAATASNTPSGESAAPWLRPLAGDFSTGCSPLKSQSRIVSLALSAAESVLPSFENERSDVRVRKSFLPLPKLARGVGGVAVMSHN